MFIEKIIKWIGEFIRRFSNLRDGLLVIAGATYILGYLVWSFHAWKNRLGMLPALDAQYFMAGIIPLVILVAVYYLVVHADKLRKRYSEWFIKDNNTRLKKRLFTAINSCFWGALVAVVILARFSDKYPCLDPVVVIFMSIFIVCVLIMPSLGSRSLIDRFLSWYQNFVVILFIVLFGFVGILAYSEIVYPKIPQEFGGVRPNYAYLDIVLDQTSTETLQAIIPYDIPNTNGIVVRSNLVDVYFVGSDTLLVKAHGQAGRNTPTYKLQRDIIQAVIWSDQGSNVEENLTTKEQQP